MIEEKSTPNKRSNIKNSRKRRSYGCKKSKNNVEINKNITPINLSILKKKKIEDLQKSIFKMIPNYDGGILKQELVFNILRWQASQRGKIYGEGILECFQEGYGFLRESSYNQDLSLLNNFLLRISFSIQQIQDI